MIANSLLPTDLVAPDFARATLADVFPAAFAAVATGIGPTAADRDARDRLGLPPVRSVLVLLVDGLGANLLAANAAHAPFLTAAMSAGTPAGGGPVTAGFPTTTAASLATLGVGVPPGVHGMTGYQVRVPGTRQVVNALQWDPSVDPLAWQPRATVMERAEQAGVRVTCVAPPQFAGSGLTTAALRGGSYVGVSGTAQRLAAAGPAQAGDGPCLTYMYYGAIDRTGHVAGCHSAEWRAELEKFDAFAEALAATVPPDGLLLVTADHGMVDIDPAAIVDPADHASDPALMIGIEVFAGEGRCRYLHTRAGAASDVLAIWKDGLPSEEFVVLSRGEAIDGGLFGPQVNATAVERIGDVIVLPRRLGAVFVRGVDSRTVRSLVGQHGSLTPDEVYVPLLAVPGGTGGSARVLHRDDGLREVDSRAADEPQPGGTR